ncbi:30S ribosomal protein S19e [Halosimplex carlsbadense 2-9-1]|uniref:Small ribosomal subunit protein eS19 n=1 Tax=Halosimplex carlsbadense 2-9-1 TaxID=797114 RepID=M0D6C3_9EURY|nr:30S ribosomal protein S19e [Halosimplex carlsbadense]ELZ29714.1 30S ribosomal protein S19e [Halosimplex carlsbadense 2-9-1]
MTTLYDVPAEDLNEAVAERLDEEADVQEPDWLKFAKTGVGRELPPEQEDFWQLRAASLLRKVAVDGPTGVGALRTAYGGTKQGSNRYVVRPNQTTDGSGKIVRRALQQLEEAGYVQTAEGEGRRITAEGQSLLDDVAGEVLEDLDRPELERYA